MEAHQHQRMVTTEGIISLVSRNEEKEKRLIIIIIILSLFHLSSCKYKIIKQNKSHHTLLHTPKKLHSFTLFSHLFIIHAQSQTKEVHDNFFSLSLLHSTPKNPLQKCRKFKSSSPFPTTPLLLASCIFIPISRYCKVVQIFNKKKFIIIKTNPYLPYFPNLSLTVQVKIKPTLQKTAFGPQHNSTKFCTSNYPDYSKRHKDSTVVLYKRFNIGL